MEKMLDSFDYFQIRSLSDKIKLPMNKEYYKAKTLYYDSVLLQPEHP